MKIRNTIIVGLSLFAASFSLYACEIKIRNVKINDAVLLSTLNVDCEIIKNTNEEQASLEAEARERELAELRAQREAAQKKREEEERRLAELREARQQLRKEYILTIQKSIQQVWTRPPTSKVGMNCTVKVFQIPGGEIISSELVSPCNADQATRRSIETAINRVTALPYRGYESVFEREIILNFNHN